MTEILWSITLLSLCNNAFAIDCTSQPKFEPSGFLSASVTVELNTWKNGEQQFDPVCKKIVQVPLFDVQGREDAAYYCLKPKESEIVSCPTYLATEMATITVVPASWIRTWNKSSFREYRFHAYAQKNNIPDFYLDIFSRTLTQKLSPQSTIIEGSFASGPMNPLSGYWIRVEFKEERDK